MKKVIGKINLPELTDCHDLEQDYKVTRSNLKKYLKSLQHVRAKASLFQENLAKSNKSLLDLHKDKCFKEIKKGTELDYYTMQGCKVFKKIGDHFAKPISAYHRIVKRTEETELKIQKCIDETRQSFRKNSESHEEVVWDYAAECFPETTTFLYKLGFVEPDKVAKKENKYKEEGLVEETNIYIGILDQEIEQMEALREECIKIGEDFFLSQRDEWNEALGKISDEVQELDVDEEELTDFRPGGGNENSFRSAKGER